MKRAKVVSTFFVIVTFVLTITTFAAAQVDGLDSDKLHLTDEQLKALGGILEDFHQKQLELTTQIEVKFIELRKELRKEGRFDTKIKETLSSRKANKIVTDISSLHGQLMRVRVEYLLKALRKRRKELGWTQTELAKRIGIVEPVMMTGGVAKNIGVVRALEKKAGKKIRVSPNAQVIGAIGAALVAAGTL